MTTSIMIIHDIDLLRSALGAVLSHQPDLAVIAQLAPGDHVVAAVRAGRPKVVVMQASLSDQSSLDLARRVQKEVAGCAVLVISDHHRADTLLTAVDAGIRGFVGSDAAPEALVNVVRRIAAGERVIDPLLLATALRREENPLTQRQCEVLRLAAEGMTAGDIGRRLFLAPGTVRNYLSAAIRRAGARSVLEAAGLARARGWF